MVDSSLSLRRGSQPIGGDRSSGGSALRLCAMFLRRSTTSSTLFAVLVAMALTMPFSCSIRMARSPRPSSTRRCWPLSLIRVLGPTLAIPTVARSLRWLIIVSEKQAQSSFRSTTLSPRIGAALDGRLFFAMFRRRKLCAAREARAQKPCAWLRRWRSTLSRSGLLESQALVQPLISMAHDAGSCAHQCAGLPGAGARARRPGNGARRAQAVTSRRSRSRSSHAMTCS